MRTFTLSVSALSAALAFGFGAVATAEPAKGVHGSAGGVVGSALAELDLNQSRDLAAGSGSQAVGASAAVNVAASAGFIARSAHVNTSSNMLAGLETNQLFQLAGLAVNPTAMAASAPHNASGHAPAETAAVPILAASTLSGGVWRIGADASSALLSAGLKPGDVVLAVNGMQPAAALDLLTSQSAVALAPVQVVVQREGAAETTLAIDQKVVTDALTRFQVLGAGRS